jgi:hypothetical protein
MPLLKILMLFGMAVTTAIFPTILFIGQLEQLSQNVMAKGMSTDAGFCWAQRMSWPFSSL